MWMRLSTLLALFLFSIGSAQAMSKARSCEVRGYGARGDGISKDTQAIQAAIEDCAVQGGGSVVLQGGNFVSGTIRLRDNIALTIAPDATLKGSPDSADYPEVHPVSDNRELKDIGRALIYAEKASNVAIRGGGTLDGSGDAPQWISEELPSQRPLGILIAQSVGVTIENLHVRNLAMWGVVNFENDDVVVRNLDIKTKVSGSRDGIDVVDSHGVLIEDNVIDSEDDSICLKSGNARGVKDVTVRRNRVLGSTIANGLKLGTASVGSFTNILFEDNDVANVDKSAMAVEAVDGASISNVVFRRIRFSDVGAAVYVILGKRARGMGSIDGVTFDDVSGDQRKRSVGSMVSGTAVAGAQTAYVRNITFTNFRLISAGGATSTRSDVPEYSEGMYPEITNHDGDLPAAGIYLRHVQGLTWENSSVQVEKSDVRPAVVRVDVMTAARRTAPGARVPTHATTRKSRPLTGN